MRDEGSMGGQSTTVVRLVLAPPPVIGRRTMRVGARPRDLPVAAGYLAGTRAARRV
jgi:hypothetical protein